ncbi:MAG: hypothetical protein U0166_24580 [Acidobacteriota bacterium]
MTAMADLMRTSARWVAERRHQVLVPAACVDGDPPVAAPRIADRLVPEGEEERAGRPSGSRIAGVGGGARGPGPTALAQAMLA